MPFFSKRRRTYTWRRPLKSCSSMLGWSNDNHCYHIQLTLLNCDTTLTCIEPNHTRWVYKSHRRLESLIDSHGNSAAPCLRPVHITVGKSKCKTVTLNLSHSRSKTPWFILQCRTHSIDCNSKWLYIHLTPSQQRVTRQILPFLNKCLFCYNTLQAGSMFTTRSNRQPAVWQNASAEYPVAIACPRNLHCRRDINWTIQPRSSSGFMESNSSLHGGLYLPAN